MKLLIHACCADCLLKMVESIKKENKFEEIAVYYYNPNIHPRSEYQSRLKAMQLMIKSIKLIIPDWKPSDYFEVVKNKEKGKRCIDCWNLRLKKTAEFAKKNGFEAFSSTLLTSEYQDSDKIQKIGGEIAKKYKIEFLIPKNICKKLETKGFYKQVFCGCCYSLTERFEEKFS
jgi:predicted adenine nucleotide alpha hydrolase (AANH) superfamily ATPase